MDDGENTGLIDWLFAPHTDFICRCRNNRKMVMTFYTKNCQGFHMKAFMIEPKTIMSPAAISPIQKPSVKLLYSKKKGQNNQLPTKVPKAKQISIPQLMASLA